jgi:hypothetical protein
MSYDMVFRGEFAVQSPLPPEHVAYLRAFNRTRRKKRDVVDTGPTTAICGSEDR